MDSISEEVLQRIAKIKRVQKKVPDAEYWRRLNPQCSITEQPFPESATPYPISCEAMQRHLEQIKKDGYFQTEPIVDPLEVDKLCQCIATVVRHGHPPSYALVYDEFYRVMSNLTNVLTPLLGPDFQLVLDEYAAYYIRPGNRATGTSPHRDSLRTATSIEPDGMPTLVNVWIPLTDATELNSCIYVLPAQCDPYYPHAGRQLAATSSPDEIHLRISDLTSIRALPAKAGSILCWCTHLLHWGSRSSEYAAYPRISFATYYQSRRAAPYHEATMDIPSALPFAKRVYLIEKAWRRVGVKPMDML